MSANKLFLALMEGLLPPGMVPPPPSTELMQLPDWDSLKQLKLVLDIEDLLGHQMEPEVIETLITLGDVAAVLSVAE